MARRPARQPRGTEAVLTTLPTIYELLTRTIPGDRAQEHLRSGFVRVGDRVVYDPDTEIAEAAKATITLRPPPATEHPND